MSSEKIVEYLSCEISNYLEDIENNISLDHDIFVCRKDGVCLFKELSENVNAQTVGALVAGMWQAAESVNSINTISVNEYMLQFSTSQQGVMVYPLYLEDEIFLLTTLFGEELNPGKLKNSCRKLRDQLVNNYTDYQQMRPKEISNEKKKQEFLFSNISDKEIDQLFSFAGS